MQTDKQSITVTPPHVKTDGRRTQAERVAESARRLRLALAELIAEQGYERTTAAQIGERAGYSRGMVRDRYGSKEALLEAMHAEYEQLLIGETEKTAAAPGLDRATAGLDRLITLASSAPVLLRAIFILSFEAVGTVDVMRPTVRRWVDALEGQARVWLTAGREDGSMRADLDAEAEARRFLAEAISDGYRWLLDGDDAAYVRHLRWWRGELLARFASSS